MGLSVVLCLTTKASLQRAAQGLADLHAPRAGGVLPKVLFLSIYQDRRQHKSCCSSPSKSPSTVCLSVFAHTMLAPGLPINLGRRQSL